MKTAKDVIKAIKDNDVKYVALRFTDPRGKWQHVTFDQSLIDEDAFADGLMFDGSSIAGWKAINESDMTLMPDPSSACMDPFFAASTMVINCDILDPASGQPYGRDPRGIAKKAEMYLKSTGIGDACFFGPEAEFFVFDDVRFKADASIPASRSTRSNCRPIPIRPTRAAITATASAPRAAIFRCRRRIRRRTCAAKCWPPWPRWARSSRSITTKWRPPSTNLASSSAR